MLWSAGTIKDHGAFYLPMGAARTAGMNMAKPRYPWLGLMVSLAICFAAARIGGAVTAPKIGNWYGSGGDRKGGQETVSGLFPTPFQLG
jgi:hypothetical protein